MRLDYYLILIGGVIFGFLCSRLARKKLRSPIFWFYMGALFGLFALTVLVFLNKLEEKKENFSSIPIIDDHFWYYVDENRKQLGPFSVTAILKKIFNKEIFNNTYLWNETMDSWKKLHEIEAFTSYLKNIEPTN